MFLITLSLRIMNITFVSTFVKKILASYVLLCTITNCKKCWSLRHDVIPSDHVTMCQGGLTHLEASTRTWPKFLLLPALFSLKSQTSSAPINWHLIGLVIDKLSSVQLNLSTQRFHIFEKQTRTEQEHLCYIWLPPICSLFSLTSSDLDKTWHNISGSA